MRAAVLLRDLSSQGVTLEAHGFDLVVDGPTETLTDSLVEALRAFKAELLKLLLPTENADAWDAAEWQAYLGERAATREHSGGLSRAEAERLALEDTVTHWLCLHAAPATDPRRGCVHCGAGDQAVNTLLPVLAPSGHVWVHDGCWETWHSGRRRDASAALARAGVHEPGGASSHVP